MGRSEREGGRGCEVITAFGQHQMSKSKCTPGAGMLLGIWLACSPYGITWAARPSPGTHTHAKHMKNARRARYRLQADSTWSVTLPDRPWRGMG